MIGENGLICLIMTSEKIILYGCARARVWEREGGEERESGERVMLCLRMYETLYRYLKFEHGKIRPADATLTCHRQNISVEGLSQCVWFSN